MDSDQYIENIRSDFPALKTLVNSYPLAYLDNAATTQKPQVVIDALRDYYSTMNANVHRGVHFLSETATEAYELSRTKVQRFINAKHHEECIFVRGTTEAINLVATSFGQKFVSSGDEILISGMEHHSNIVPWKLLCDRTGAKLSVIPVTQTGELDLTNLDDLLKTNTKIVAITHVSNALGTINPIKDIITRAHAKNIPVLIDGAQALAHLQVDVQDLDCDFYTISSHKDYGPMGIGALYGKKEWLDQMPPYQGGGEMILQVTFDKVTYNALPHKFEAGTPSVGDAIAWGAAIAYIETLDRDIIKTHEQKLLKYLTNKLQDTPGIKFYGTSSNKIGILSFTLDQIHPHDIGTIVNEYGVAIRTGHHCNMPLMDFLGITGTARASLAMYNNKSDVDQLCDALHKVQELFSRHK
jgi:cysteine desulfurase/selenocysteine lyase